MRVTQVESGLLRMTITYYFVKVSGALFYTNLIRCLWDRSQRTICRSFLRSCMRRAQSAGLTMALTVVGSLREAVSAASTS
jgi:hypothetical protein